MREDQVEAARQRRGSRHWLCCGRLRPRGGTKLRDFCGVGGNWLYLELQDESGVSME